MTSAAFLAVSILCLAVSSEAGAFRGDVLTNTMSVEHVRAAMMELGVQANSSRVTEERLQALEEILKPTFASMPKNEYGNLEHGAVRYVLHRLFVQRHGMYIKGLEPAGDNWAASSAAEVLDDRVPGMVQAFFEQRLQGKGLGLHELAVMTATLEHLIHDEAVERLKVAYQALGMSEEQRAGPRSAQDLVDTYMMLFILGRNASVTPEGIKRQKDTISQMYPGWAHTRKFSQQVLRSVEGNKADKPEFAGRQLAFSAMAQVVEEIGERYGRWQDAECQDLKSALVKLEHNGTGRVLLKDFYSNTLSGTWQFSESVDYLRALGALEEGSQRSVLIPNYVNAKSNCLASSGMYSVCCINECDALLGYLEGEISAPDGEPSRIMELVAGLSSATVPAPRALPLELRTRLDEIADHHGGRVPLHGRLFAQWLHHAYPRECPFPHKSGTTSPMTADQWMQERGADARISKAELEQHQENVEVVEPVTLPWSKEEELVVPVARRRGLRSLATAAAVVSVLVALGRTLATAASAMSFGKHKHQQLLPFTKQHMC